MERTMLWKSFIQLNPELSSSVKCYKSVKDKPNAIELYFEDGRRGVFEINRGKFKLTLEG